MTLGHALLCEEMKEFVSYIPIQSTFNVYSTSSIILKTAAADEDAERKALSCGSADPRPRDPNRRTDKTYISRKAMFSLFATPF